MARILGRVKENSAIALNDKPAALSSSVSDITLSRPPASAAASGAIPRNVNITMLMVRPMSAWGTRRCSQVIMEIWMVPPSNPVSTMMPAPAVAEMLREGVQREQGPGATSHLAPRTSEARERADDLSGLDDQAEQRPPLRAGALGRRVRATGHGSATGHRRAGALDDPVVDRAAEERAVELCDPRLLAEEQVRPGHGQEVLVQLA